MSNTSTPPTLAAFTAQVNSGFAVRALPGVSLALSEAAALPGAASAQQQFSLIFRGPPQQLLEQATWALAHPVLGTLAIFLVPLGRDAAGIDYQAIFN